MSRTGRKQEQNQLVLGQDRELTEAELEALISQVEAEGMLRAPVGLKSRVMEKTRRMDVQMIVRTQELPKRLSFFWYSVKITAAAAAAMFLIFAIPQDLGMPDLSTLPAMETEWDGGPRKTLAEKVDQKAAEVAEQVNKLARKLFEK